MATIGQSLTTPETGWRRYDDIDSRILYLTNYNTYTGAGRFNNTIKFWDYSCRVFNTKAIQFKIKSTKLRIIAEMSTDRATNCKVYIDSIEYVMNQKGSTTNQTLCFEKINLEDTIHDISIWTGTDGSYTTLVFDAIDIDQDGYLVHPILNQISNINNIKVGDIIPCRYTALTSGQPGYFSELGTCIADEILVTGTPTPDGLFYLIMAGYDSQGRIKLIADRNLQTNISWDALNSTGIASGLKLDTIPTNIASSSYYSTYYPTGAFDGINDLSHQWHSSTIFPHILNFEYLENVIINSYKISSSVSNSLKTWYFEAYDEVSNNWITLHSIVNSTQWESDGYVRTYNFSNTNSYKKYRLRITAGYRTEGYCSVWELTPIISKYNGHSSYYVCLLTGGISATDTDNEWDKIIVNSTLNGAITAGDNTIWNWNGIYSWTSTTNIAGNIYRIQRGSTSVLNSRGIGTTGTSGIGFRPVILVESYGGSNKFLIKQGDNYYSLKSEFYINNQFVPITLINGESPNDDDFKNNGFDDINDLIKKINTEENNKPIDQFGEIKRTSVSFTTTDNKIFIVDPLTNVPFKQNSVICYKDGIEAIPDEINYDEGIVVFNTEQIGIMTFDYTYIVPFDILLYKPNN